MTTPRTPHTLYHRVGLFKAHLDHPRVSPSAPVAPMKRSSQGTKTIKKESLFGFSGMSKKAPPQKKNMPRDSPHVKTLISVFWKSCALWLGLFQGKLLTLEGIVSLKYCHYSTVTIVLSLTTSLSRKEIRPNPGPKKKYPENHTHPTSPCRVFQGASRVPTGFP